MARIEIRISDIEKSNLDNLKQQLGVTTSELFREFLNSYDIMNMDYSNILLKHHHQKYKFRQ